MKRIILVGFVSVLALPLFAAEQDTKAVVMSAAKSLGEKANYAWNTTAKQESSARSFEFSSKGQTEREGFTPIALTFGDRTVEFVLKNGKVAVKQEQEWKSAEELEGNEASMARRFKVFKVPAAEAAELVLKAKELKAGADGLYSGELTEQGVKELFARYRREGRPDAKDTKGSVKFWIKGGALTKYEYVLEGKMTMGQNQEEAGVKGTSTVEIKDVGNTKVTVPDAAKKKLL